MTDPLVDTPAFREAVEAMDRADAQWEKALRAWDGQGALPDLSTHRLVAALPALRRGLAEELRKEADIHYSRHPFLSQRIAWKCAADHLEGK